MGYLNEFPHAKTWDSDLRQILEMFMECKDLPTLYRELKEFVDNYFTDLDVQNEINSKLDAMYNSGELESMLQPFFNEIEKELRVTNARISTLVKLDDSEVEGYQEVVEGRVDYTGKEWDTIGDHVRGVTGQLSSENVNLKKDISNAIDEVVVINGVDRGIYRFYVPQNENIKIESVSGNVFGGHIEFRALRADKTQINYWLLNANANSREITNTLGEDIFYIQLWNLEETTEEVKASVIYEDNLQHKVEKLPDLINRQVSCVEIQGSQIRNGSTLNNANQDAICTKVIKTNAKAIKVYTNRPNKEGCVYGYGFATVIADLEDTAGQSANVLKNIGYDNRNSLYELAENDTIFGVSICISEINVENGTYNSLRVEDFKAYTISVYDVTGDYIKANGVPNFYKDYLAERVNDIRNKDIAIDGNGDSFIFISDLHDENNYYSPYLAKNIMENTSVNRLVYGGDYINEPKSKEIAVKQLFDRVSKCRVVDDTVFLVGNHDTNPYGVGSVSKSELYGILHKHLEKYIDTDKKTYFYRDNTVQKIRYIYLDSGENGDIEEVQAQWLNDKANELSNEWTIVVLVHESLYTTTKDDRTNIYYYPCVEKIRSALSNISAKVACVVSGHCHIDLVDTSGDYPIIAITCDASGSQTSISSDNRVGGTINEQSFDVFHIDTVNRKIYTTRIGGGKNNVLVNGDYSANDREFNY